MSAPLQEIEYEGGLAPAPTTRYKRIGAGVNHCTNGRRRRARNNHRTHGRRRRQSVYITVGAAGRVTTTAHTVGAGVNPTVQTGGAGGHVTTTAHTVGTGVNQNGRRRGHVTTIAHTVGTGVNQNGRRRGARNNHRTHGRHRCQSKR